MGSQPLWHFYSSGLGWILMFVLMLAGTFQNQSKLHHVFAYTVKLHVTVQQLFFRKIFYIIICPLALYTAEKCQTHYRILFKRANPDTCTVF